MTPEARLEALGLTLPPVSAPIGAYLTCKRQGDLLYLSGAGPIVEGKALWQGKVGSDVSPEAAYEAARISALNLLALGHIRVVEVEADALGAHDAYRHHGFGCGFGLGSCFGGGSEAGGDASELLCPDTTLAEDGSRSVGVDTVKVCLAWGDDEAGHVYSSRADQILGVALGRVAVGTMLGSRDDDSDVALVLLP